MPTKVDYRDVTELNFKFDVTAKNSVPGPPSAIRLVVRQGDITMSFPARFDAKNATVSLPALERHMDPGVASATLEIEVSKRVFRPLTFDLDLSTDFEAKAAHIIGDAADMFDIPNVDATPAQQKTKTAVQAPAKMSENPAIARAQVLNNLKKLRRQ